MSASLDTYALPRLPSTAARGPTRAFTCVVLLFLCAATLAIVPIAGSLFSRADGAAVALTATVPHFRAASQRLPHGPEAPEAPEAALRFERAAAAVGSSSGDSRALGPALGAHWAVAFRAADDAQARLLADAVRTLGWLVAHAHGPR